MTPCIFQLSVLEVDLNGLEVVGWAVGNAQRCPRAGPGRERFAVGAPNPIGL